MIGVCIGGLPTDPYSQNVGLICTTKVVAKRVFLIVGIALAIGIESVPDILRFCPQLLKNILGSSLMVSFLVVFFLNIIVPEDNREE